MIKCPKCGYEHNSEDALYCGLCYELLKKIAKPAQPEEAETGPQKTEASPFLTIALIAGILSGAGVYFYGASSTAGVKEQAALEVVRQQEKELAADKLLAAYNSGREELLGELAKTPIDPEGFSLQGQYTKKLFKLEEDYSSGIGSLALGCPNAAEGAKDPAYSKWCENFAAVETASMENFNKRYQEFIQRAGAR
ncbi:MAG: hypothetical protein PHV36_07475 [Elusimicrobiales bacterium]|nr:hypothetical protein [Elusimicrobiales bacterium]